MYNAVMNSMFKFDALRSWFFWNRRVTSQLSNQGAQIRLASDLRKQE